MYKRLCAIWLALALLLGAQAFAFKSESYAPWDGASAPASGLHADFGGAKIALSFDPTAEYSHCTNGILQACFFAFDASQQNYLEFYLLLPQNVAAGDVLRIGTNSGCSATLYEVSQYNETMYFAGELNSAAWPAESALEIRIDAASTVGDSIHISGSMSGMLCRVINAQSSGETLSMNEAHFDFTLPSSSGASAVAPAFTLPPDYRVL